MLCRNIRQLRPAILAFGLMFPWIIVVVALNIFDYSATSVSLPSNLFMLLGVCVGYFFYKRKNYLLPLVLISLMYLWIAKGEKMYGNYKSFGVTTNNVYEKFPDIKLFDTAGVDVLSQYLDNTLLLDLWNSHCGICYQQFPLIDSLSKTSKNSAFKILVVNIPFKKEVMKDNFKLLDQFNYSFTKLYTYSPDMMDSLKIRYFPAAIVVKNRMIIFRGEFWDAVEFLNRK